LKEVSVLTEGDPMPGIVPHLVRVSGDGRVFAWRTSTGSEGHGMATLVLDKTGAKASSRGMGDYLLTPGPDGRNIFCLSGILAYGNVGGLAYEQPILFIPDAKLLITIPVERTQMILRRVELPAAEKAAPGN